MIDDIRIAREVCHWFKMYDTWYRGTPTWIKPERTGYVAELMEFNTKWEPQRYIKHAMEIADALHADGWDWTLASHGGLYAFTALHNDGRSIIGVSETKELSICLAAMQLVEKEIEDE